MNRSKITLAAALAAAVTLATPARAVDGDSTYQGRLTDATTGEPIGGTSVEVRFEFFTQASGGSAVGSSMSIVPVAEDGTFSAAFDAEALFETGGQYWADVYIDDQLMTPRQKITTAPASIFAKHTRGITVTPNLDPEFGEDNEFDIGFGTDIPAAQVHIREANLNAENLDPSVSSNTNLLLESRFAVLTLLGEPSGTVDAAIVLGSTDANGAAATRVDSRWALTKRSASNGNDLEITFREFDGESLVDQAVFDFSTDGRLTLNSNADGPGMLNIMDIDSTNDTPVLVFGENTTPVFYFETDYAGTAGNNHLELSSFLQPSVMTWTAGGNVGIGASIPTARLDVRTDQPPASSPNFGAVANFTYTHPTDNLNAAVRIDSEASDGLALYASGGFGGGTAARLRGAVSIESSGTEPALSTLASDSGGGVPLLCQSTQVFGQDLALFRYFNDDVAQIGTNGDLQITGNGFKPGGGSWSVLSDGRLKKNVAPLDGALDTLLALRGVTYEYKDAGDPRALPGPQVGFIAQDVAEVQPNWVDLGDDGYYTLSIKGFEALTVEAVREIADENAELLERVATLEAVAEENAELRERVATLEALVKAMLEEETH